VKEMSARIVELAATVIATVRDEIGCTVQRAATGRRVSFMTAEEKRIDVLVADWFATETTERFMGHPAIAEFEEALRTATSKEGKLVVFRGRIFSASTITDPFEFGPPPRGIAPQGRYNREGGPVLYLSTTIAGVAAEMNRYQRKDSHLHCQRFMLDMNNLAVAELSRDDCAPILAITFDYSELERDPAKYFRSQGLAEVVERCGFDGMLVPGVRGSNDNRYHNLVMLGASDRWKQWVDKDELPSRVPPPEEPS
jgi:hypothetical protein